MLVKELNGFDFVILVHQGHGLAGKGHAFIDKAVQEVVDVEDGDAFGLGGGGLGAG